MSHRRRIKAVVQYDGIDYSGFQRQKNAMSVQEKLETGLSRFLKHPVIVRASGRTDKGVHARGQVVVFDTTSKMAAGAFPHALLGYLPEDIILSSAEEVPIHFNPIKDAVSKTYCYRIWRGETPDIFWNRYSLWRRKRLDFDAMKEEANYLVGRHDFRNFRIQRSSVKTTVRTVFRADWRRGGDLWEFYITGDGFLYKMVRLIVGTLIDVGRGRFPQGTVLKALRESSHAVGVCAPPRGLCLEEVRFS